MESMIRHVNSYLNILRDSIPGKVIKLEQMGICRCDYKTDNVFPAEDKFRPYKWGEMWGDGNDSHAWFHIPVDVPEDMRGDDTLELCLHTDRGGWDADNPQFLCYVDGVMRQGFDTNHREIVLAGGGKVKDFYDVYVYAYTGPRIEKSCIMPYLRTVNDDVRQLYYDIYVPRLALDTLGTNTPEYMEILTALSMALRQLNVLEPRGEEFRESVGRARVYLKEHLYDRARESETAVICIGHTHIDVAWLWTLRQTREKAQRSFATVIELMKRFPDYKFMSSQAYLYKAVKEEAPELYEEIKKMIKAGRWEVEGAMWVEADCNLTSGESLVRQVMYGKNFFRDEFGVESKVLWLPDVFGYSAALPQILRKSGVDWFVTSKISWNDVNTMPYDVFSWEGIDGTPINSYFLTAQNKGRTDGFTKGTTYVATTDPRMVAGSYNRFQQKELTRESIVTFGYGDGGGGPTDEMLRFAERQRKGIPGLPNAKIGFAGDMLKRLAKNIDGNPRLPKWRGELYLEFHRGTYTSNARNKKNNRDCEFLMLDSELLSVMAGIGAGLEFPKQTLHDCWETVLTNQFHDIIPGSSIREVYEQCDRDYAELRRITKEVREKALDELVSKIATDKKYIVFNPHSFTGRGYVEADGRSVYVENVPPKGYKAIDLRMKRGEADLVKVDETSRVIDTPFYRCEFDENWNIRSLYDKDNSREVISGGPGNEFRIYEDYPDQYDAWEIQEFSGYKYYPLHSFEKAGAVRHGGKAGVRITRRHAESTVTQTVWFYGRDRRIDFETEAEWDSIHRILRTAFPVDINTDKASFEIQFGTIERPTHKNTSWDRQKFETCAHKFADLSEGDYGVSLLNNCKYGHDIHGNMMMLTLLKRPTYPSEVADKGHHSFTYSLLPHKGALKDADTVREGYMLNYPMYAVKAAGQEATSKLPKKRLLAEEWSPVCCSDENLVIETVKEAEYSEDIIIRGYEAKNFRGTAEFTLGFDAKEVWLSDLSENKVKKLELSGKRSFKVPYRPFEIVTLLIRKSI
ncbi:MAG: alpha-mannosidase [Clostridia bacterium]|nr:alpha-mannosidase [Clostridia bacterium]